MPKEITHINFADETINELKKSGKFQLSSLLSDNETYLHFGSIAVDTFYYSFKIPFIEKDYFQWGDLIHGAEGNDTSLPLIQMLEILRNNKEDPYFKQKLAFTCGFLTHMAMDINFHPFVYYFSGNYYDESPSVQIDAQMRHRLIEGWIDLFILEKMAVKLEDFKALDEINKNTEINLKLLEFLAQSCASIWQTDKNIFKFLKKGYLIQINLTAKIFKNKSFAELARLLNDIFENKLRAYLALFYPVNYQKIPEFIIEFDLFKHPVTGEEFKGNLYNIWNNGLKLSTDFLTAVNDFIFADSDKEKLKSVIKGYSLDVGLMGVNVRSVKHFAPWKLIP